MTDFDPTRRKLLLKSNRELRLALRMALRRLETLEPGRNGGARVIERCRRALQRSQAARYLPEVPSLLSSLLALDVFLRDAESTESDFEN